MHFCNDNVWISIEIPQKCVPKVPINNILALVQIMAYLQVQAIIWTNDGKFADAYIRHSAQVS